VYSNIFIGAQAAVAFVGAVNVEVSNNTIYFPERWVLRILQETVDPTRFLECGDNIFRNNIIVRNAGLSTETNIGPNTRPQTFTFSNNLWYYPGNNNWSGPSIPVPDVNGIINQNPLLADPGNADFHIPPGSPAAGKGFAIAEPVLDYYGLGFAQPRSIGAAEANPVSGTTTPVNGISLRVFPNPARDWFCLELDLNAGATVQVELVEITGRWKRLLFNGFLPAGLSRLPVEAANDPAGAYWLTCQVGKRKAVARRVILGRQ